MFTYTTTKERIALALTALMAMGSGAVSPLTSIVFGASPFTPGLRKDLLTSVKGGW